MDSINNSRAGGTCQTAQSLAKEALRNIKKGDVNCPQCTEKAYETADKYLSGILRSGSEIDKELVSVVRFLASNDNSSEESMVALKGFLGHIASGVEGPVSHVIASVGNKVLGAKSDDKKSTEYGNLLFNAIGMKTKNKNEEKLTRAISLTNSSVFANSGRYGQLKALQKGAFNAILSSGVGGPTISSIISVAAEAKDPKNQYVNAKLLSHFMFITGNEYAKEGSKEKMANLGYKTIEHMIRGEGITRVDYSGVRTVSSMFVKELTREDK